MMRTLSGIRFVAFLFLVVMWAALVQPVHAELAGAPSVERTPIEDAPEILPEDAYLVCDDADFTRLDHCPTIKWGDYIFWIFEFYTTIYVAAYDTSGELIAYKTYEDDYSIYDIVLDAEARTVTLRGIFTDITGNPRIQFSWDDLHEMVAVTRPEITLEIPGGCIVEGQADNITVKVAGREHIPTGTVTFRYDGDEWGTATVQPDGTASIADPALSAGRYFITLEYSGDDNHHPATVSLPLIVCRDASDGGPRVIYLTKAERPAKAPDGTSLYCYSGIFEEIVPADCPVIEWNDYRFWVYDDDENRDRMTVAAYNADGEMKGYKTYVGERYLQDIYIGADRTVSIYGQVYSYSGDVRIQFPWEDLVTMMGKYTTAATLQLSSSAVMEGEAVTLTARVEADASTPTGSVIFRNRGAALHADPLPLNEDGTASLTIADLPAGRHYITAEYSGDSLHDVSTSASLPLIVNRNAAEGEPRVVYRPESEQPAAMPDDTILFCFQDADSIGRDDCPVIEWGDYVFWIYNADHSGTSLTVAAYDGNGSLAGLRRYDGLRYIYEITVDAAMKQVTLWGQSNQNVTIKWDTLAEIAKMTQTALTVSGNPVEAGDDVTLTAEVKGLFGTPTGTVEFVEQDAKLDTAVIPLQPDGTATLVLTGLEAGGYTFTAVYSGDADNSGSRSGTVVLTVQPRTMYTVFFHSDGETIGDMTVEKNAKIVNPPEPVKPGHTLEGWYIDPSFTEAWSFADDVVKHNMTLYANWTPLIYRLNYTASPGGKIVGVASQTVSYGEDGSPVTAEADPGYHFVRWSDGKTHAVRTDTNVTSDLNVSAVFDPNMYAVVFHTNGGNDIPVQTVAYGGKAVEPDKPTKDGHIFAGWYRDDGMFEQEWNFSEDTVPVGGVDLYAKWIILAPDAPIITSAAAGNGSVTLSWSLVPRAAGYRVYASEMEGVYGSFQAELKDTEYELTGLANGKKVYVVVTAYNEGGESGHSNEVSAVPQVPAPGSPVLQSAAAGDRQVHLVWDPAPGAEMYKIYVSETGDDYGEEKASVSGTVYQYTVTGLSNGTAYYFTAAAASPGGTAYSNTLMAVPLTAPAPPAHVRAEAGHESAVVHFAPSADDGGSPILKYVVMDQDGTIVAEGNSSPIEITGLTNGQSYRFIVYAVNAAGRSPDSNLSNSVTPTAPSVGDGGDDDEPGDPGSGGDDDEQDDPGSGGGDDDKQGDPGSGGNGSAPDSPADEPDNLVDEQGQDKENIAVVLVNGRPIGVEIPATTADGDLQAAAFTVDSEWMDEFLAGEEQGVVISIRAMTASDAVIGLLNAQTVKHMAQQDAVIELITEDASYSLPTRHIPVDALAQQFGPDAALQDIRISVVISAVADEQLAWIERAVRDQGYSIAAPPVQFTVRGEYEGNTIEVSAFHGFVERTISIPDDADYERITTAVVIEADGTLRHVPTKIMEVDGRMAAVINSLTNSTYALIWNPIQFADTSGHWAEDAIHDMGARMIVHGTGDNNFRPNQPITRAEFAAIIVRALGLTTEHPDKGIIPFTDVREQDWFSGAARTAHAYQLITGTGDGTFRPWDPMTREQAMVVMAKAMAITGLADKLEQLPADQLLSTYDDADQVSNWARIGAAASLQAGVIAGRSNGQLAPQAVITRAETAIMMQRLLQQSELI